MKLKGKKIEQKLEAFEKDVEFFLLTFELKLKDFHKTIEEKDMKTSGAELCQAQ